MDCDIVGENVDTWIVNVRGELAEELASQFDQWKTEAQALEEDVPSPWHFCGEVLFIKAHGAGRQWRWILHSPSLHLELGLGKRTGRVGKARLSAAFLWEHGPIEALPLLYTFLVGVLGSERFTLQVSEVHLCVDVAGWEPTLEDARAFITRGHRRRMRQEGTGDGGADDGDDGEAEKQVETPRLEVSLNGRRWGTFDFSRGAAHSCCIYDKTAELSASRKDWMQVVWAARGWDGESRVTRVEFRYKRECLKELGVDEPYAFLDQLPALWAYSTKVWLRHTTPTADPNRGRWPLSPQWELVQQAPFLGDSQPGVRERKTRGDLLLICQMLAGCSTTASALLTNALPLQDDGTHFLIWFMNWLETYLQEKGVTYEDITEAKRLKLGVVAQEAVG
jgi:hypothetical protein